MKKHYYFNAGLIVLLLLASATLNAQKFNLKTEVLVYIMPDSLELPAHEKGQLGLQCATIKSSTLEGTLVKLKAKSIAKAFPTWASKDSVITRYDGKQVETPPFHRIFSLAFNTESEADSAIIVLKKAAAKANNSLGISGLDWNARIFSKNISDVITNS